MVSDRSGWWNLYRISDGSTLEPLAPRDSEFGVPQWVFGLSTYSFLGDGRVICSYEEGGSQRLAALDASSRELLPLDLPYRCFAPSIASEGDQVAFVGGGPATPMELAVLDFSSRSVEACCSQPSRT